LSVRTSKRSDVDIRRNSSLLLPALIFCFALVIRVGAPCGRTKCSRNKALASQPNYPEAENNLGILYARRGMTDRAIEYFRKAVERKRKSLRDNLRPAHREDGVSEGI